MAKAYTVRFEPDEGDWWTVTIPEVPGVITQARTIEQGRKRVREALAAAIGEQAAAHAELLIDVDLPVAIRRLLVERRKTNEAAQRYLAKAREMNEKAAKVLEQAGVSRRDSAELLDVSFQRVQQLLHPTPPPPVAGARGPKRAREGGTTSRTRPH